MDFILSKASDPDFHENIRLNSLEELVAFMNKINSEVIIGINTNGTLRLTIYDDYIE